MLSGSSIVCKDRCAANPVNVQYYDWVLIYIINVHGYGMPDISGLSIIIAKAA